MTREEAQSVIMTEQKCVDRVSTDRCNRDCVNCDLIMDDAVINEAYNMAIKALEQPERKRGRLEYAGYGGFGNWHCTACRQIIICNGDYDFCPHCGADLREGEQE